jgi:hypothetical protein
VLFTTPTGASLGSTITLTFASAFGTSSIIEDDVDIADDGSDLTTATTCGGSVQASVTMASNVLTITICPSGGGAIAAASAVTIEIGTNATSSGTGVHQITNPSSAGSSFVSIGGTFGDSGSIFLPISGDDSFAVTANVPSGPGGGNQNQDPQTDVTAPVITNIVVSQLTASSATVSWETNEPATSELDYGLTIGFDSGVVAIPGYHTDHSIDLTGLSEGMTYFFQIRAADIAGNSTTSAIQSFTTLDETAPEITNIEVVDITATSARVTWDTNENADSHVWYGLTSAYTDSESNFSLVTSHSILLTSLEHNTTYHFQVFSADAAGNEASSANETFTTDEDGPPGNVFNLSIVEADTALTLVWFNPNDDDLAGIFVLMCENEYPDGPTDVDCVVVLNDMAEAVTVLNLTNGTTYYFGVFAYDEAGQFASGALESGTPRAPEIELPNLATCGDNVCSEDESVGSCPTDCADPTSTSCGDAICSVDESFVTCPADCEEGTEEPTSLGAEEGNAELHYTVADGTIELTATDSGVVEVISTSDVALIVPADTVLGSVKTMMVTIGEEDYLMRLDVALGLYVAEVTMTDVLTVLDVDVLITHEDGSTDRISSYLRILAKGLVYQVIDGEEVPVTAAKVTLFEDVDGDWTVWDGSPYNQYNPTNVGKDGSFYWYVPQGTYRVSAAADGYTSQDSTILTIDQAIVNPRIRLTAREKEEEEIATESTQESFLGGVSEGLLSLLAELFLTTPSFVEVQQLLKVLRELSGVEEAAKISTPALAITAGASVVVLSIAFDLLPFLQYLFTAPILFFWRRKRKGYGVVYNAIAKTPIDLAVVRLFTVEPDENRVRGRLVQSRVTDPQGRYFFLVQPGRYRLIVTKPGFEFPSTYLRDEKVDGSYLDLYHSEVLEVKEENAVITANIPMDPSQAAAYQAPTSVRRRRYLRGLQHALAFLGVLAASLFAIIRPTVFSISMVVVQILIYLLTRRLARPSKPVSWGIVYSKETGRPLSRVVARIFESKYNKLLETQVTDSKGRYAFLLGPNQYYASFEKEGFIQKDIPLIDYSAAQEPQGFAQEIPLETARPDVAQ